MGLTRYAGAGCDFTGARQSGQVLLDRPSENHEVRHCGTIVSAQSLGGVKGGSRLTP